MTREAVAAIDGARAAGATGIWVKDAHETGRNLITAMLPEDVTLIRAWAGHPLCMVQELDASFDAVMMIGYHDAAGSEANSLAHTLSSDAVEIRLNGRRASEFSVHALASSMLGVPTVFVTGDQGLMDQVAEVNPAIGRCAVKEGRGQSTVSMTPAAACKAIRDRCGRGAAGATSRPACCPCRRIRFSRSPTAIRSSPIVTAGTRARGMPATAPSASRPTTISTSCGC